MCLRFLFSQSQQYRYDKKKKKKCRQLTPGLNFSSLPIARVVFLPPTYCFAYVKQKSDKLSKSSTSDVLAVNLVIVNTKWLLAEANNCLSVYSEPHLFNH